MKELSIGEAAALRKALHEQSGECDAAKKALSERITKLEERRLGDRRQHVAEQISLISLLLRSNETPELRHMLALLERMQDQFEATYATNGEPAKVILPRDE